MEDKKRYNTANESTGEYFTITEIGKLNTRIKLYDIAGFIEDKIIPNKIFNKSWKK